MPKRTIKINLKLPSGVVATKDLIDKATNAAKDVVDASVADIAEAQKLAKELAGKGIDISAEELMNRKSGGRKRAKKKARKRTSRKRTVLSDAQKKALVDDLKGGMTIAAAAKKYGVSTATVTNLKSQAGLTKNRKKK